MIQLVNQDCLEFMKTMKPNSVDLIVTDPPYEISVKHDGGKLYANKGFDTSNKELANNEADLTIGYDFENVNELFVTIMKEINIYVWCNKTQIHKYFDFYLDKYKCKFDIICWHKINAIPTFSNKYLTDTEYLLYFHNGTGKCFPKNYDDAKTFYFAPINNEDKKKYNHPSIKPLDITSKIIRNSSKENDLVFDAFMGSGTTGVACQKLKRNFIGCELYKPYFDLAQQRINNTKNKLF